MAKKNAPKTKYKTVEMANGDKLVKPEKMSYKEVKLWAERMDQAEEMAVSVFTVVEGEPLDGAVAFHRAIADIHGWSTLAPTPGFFGSRPPTMVGVDVSPTEKIQIAWGNIQIPEVEGILQTGLRWEPSPAFIIQGTVKQRSMGKVKALIEKTQEFLKTRSIYKGRPIRISFQWMRDGGHYDVMHHAPKFWGADGVSEDDLVLPRRVMQALQLGLFAPIEDSDFFRAHKIPLKRGVCLAGPYGVGKTLISAVTAIKAQRHGWTFGYLDDCREARDVKRGMQYMLQYAPAVLFVEDIDRFMGGDRNEAMNDVLNIIDGVDTKGKELIFVATTNHYDLLNEAVRRDGRFDSTIPIPPPDAEAAARLISKYSRGLLDPSVDLGPVGEALDGRIPAFIRGVAETSKMLARVRLVGEGHAGVGLGGTITQDDLDSAIDIKKAEADYKDSQGRKKQALPGRILVELPDSFDRHEQLSGLLGHNGEE